MKTSTKLMFITAVIVTLAIVVCSGYAIRIFKSELVSLANYNLDKQIGMLADMVKQKGASLRIQDARLLAGDYTFNNNFEIPDQFTRSTGSVATIFMGDERVSTTVKDKSGNRAIGTKLKGAAHDAIFKDKATFRGEATILDEQYFTAYDPIKNEQGEIIGVLFVGIKKAEYMRNYIRLCYILSGFGLLLVVVSSAGIWAYTGRALKPLAHLVSALEKAATGDLAARVVTVGSDEIGRLGIAFNALMVELNRSMRHFFSVADAVSESVDLVRTSTRAMAAASEEVAAQAVTIATASEEMSATSSDIARNCQYAADSALAATDQTNSGSIMVQNSVTLMENIARRVDASAVSVAALVRRSEDIGAIVGTIEDIADQTNLLALNAAIEAARAGDQGRGFAVVADEVRALAERTTRATKEIAAMITSIQSETQTAVRSMSEGVNEVQYGKSETTRSGETLEEILVKIRELNMQISQVATAAEEQTATTHEITNNIQMISDVVYRSAENTRNAHLAVEKLAEQSTGLHNLVGKFRLAQAMAWDETFATGVSKFDEQHKVLFSMVNELADSMLQNRSRDVVGRVLNRLAEYTVNHFADEEQSFVQTRYPDEAAHKALHKDLVEQVVALIGRFNAGERLDKQVVIEFLQEWLVKHIKVEDKNYGAHLLKNGFM
jgi:methyl-accepting chemotaxis protein/hemerythrin